MVMDAALLHLDPNSTEAQVFYQLGRSSDQSDDSPTPSPSGNVTYIHESSFSFKFNYCSFDMVEN